MNKHEKGKRPEPFSDKAGKDRQALEAKLAELQTVYQQNELTILGLYRQLENARKTAEDCERQIQNANAHQQGVQREIDDLKRMLAPSKQTAGAAPEEVPV